MIHRRLLPVTLLTLLSPVQAEEGMDFFEKKVRPLLAERCLECHSADHRIGDAIGLIWRALQNQAAAGGPCYPRTPGAIGITSSKPSTQTCRSINLFGNKSLAGIFSSTRTLMSYEENVARWISRPLPEESAREAQLSAHEVKLTSHKEQFTKARAKLAELSKGITAESTTPAIPIAPESLPGIVLDDADAKVVGEWKHSVHLRS